MSTARWDVLDLPEVSHVIEVASRHVHRVNEDLIELDDLIQEATIMVVTTPDLIEATEEPGLLHHRLVCDLQNFVAKDRRKEQRQVSLEKITDESETYVQPYVLIETASNDYTRESIETLLPAVWDETYLYGLPTREGAPDPDMPKGSRNKATSNNLPAYIADIKTGWDKTPLTQGERRALFLAFNTALPSGPWTQAEIAHHEGVSQQAISLRIEQAIGKMMARLNGGHWYRPEEAAA